MMRFCAWILALACVMTPSMIPAAQTAAPASREMRKADLSGIQALDLATAKQIAVSDNPTLAAARTRIHQAMERVYQANAAYWPRLDAQASGSRERLPDNLYGQNGLGSSLGSLYTFEKQYDYYTAGLTASWVLFDGFARKFSRETQKWGEMQAQEADLEARRQLLSAVAAAYYNAQLAMENITIATADETFNQRQLTEAEARLRVGTGALSDVLNFKVQINAARSQRNQARLAYEQYRIGLAALMGVPDAGLPDHLPLSPLVPETRAEMKVPDAGAQIEAALSHRPDLKESNLRIRQASSQIELARAGYYPTLTFEASLNGQRYDNMAFKTDDFGYSVGLTLSYNLFSGGATRAKIHEAVWARSEAEKNHEELSITLARDVRNAIAELKRAQAELKLQRTNTGLVGKNRDLVEKEYTSGQGTLVRLTEAQRDLTTARSRLALALVSLRLAWENLETATGKILEIPNN